MIISSSTAVVRLPQATGTPQAHSPAEDTYAGSVPPTPQELRKTFGRFASGVTVVTTGEGDNRKGMTASSFTSLSVEPPLVLFCAQNGSSTLAAIKENGTFAVNVLNAGQKDACLAFAGKVDGDKFANRHLERGPATGAPLLPGALAQFECKVWSINPGGDHEIVIGEVVGLHRPAAPDDPMVFWGGKLQHPEAWQEK
jgi:flavin reductase (DIM6/NTAB) family NADH-FMN oxidoreductase RutF